MRTVRPHRAARRAWVSETAVIRVLLDCLAVKREQAGIRAVAVSLGRALAANGQATVAVLTVEGVGIDWDPGVRVHQVRLRSNDPVSRLAWRRLKRDHVAGELDVDVIVTMTPEPAGSSHFPTWIVVHDLGPLLAPAYYGFVRYARYAAALREACRESHGIVCVSGTTKLHLTRWVGADIARKAVVIPNAPKDFLTVPTSAHEPVPGGYVLYVGAFLSHKNVETVLAAFARQNVLRNERLVCAGPDYAGERRTALAPHLGAPWLDELGFVDDAILGQLYRGAGLLVFPSLFEGFGMPIYEAIRSGAPVLATRLESFEEFFGDRISYVTDPLSVDEWEREIGRLVSARRPGDGQTPARGLDRTWADVANELVQALEGGQPV